MVLIGRFITGFSGGAFVMAAPAYIAEIAETKYRGAVSTIMQLMVTIGILFINLNCSTDWRLLTGICIIPPAALALWMFWMPRSPVFLISKGDIEGAKKSLQFLRGKNAKVDDELEQMKDDFAQSQGIGSVSFKEVSYTYTIMIIILMFLDCDTKGISQAHVHLPGPHGSAAALGYQLRCWLLKRDI